MCFTRRQAALLVLPCGFATATAIALVFGTTVMRRSIGDGLLALDHNEQRQTDAPSISLGSSQTDFQKEIPNAPTCDPITGDDVGYTLVLHCSSDRLWMVQHHCDRWGATGPMSLAVLTDETADATKDKVLGYGCGLHDGRVTVVTVRKDDDSAIDYPVNKLRNLALRSVKTSHAVMLDVDFWPSDTVQVDLFSSDATDALAEDHKLAIVLPAFQLFRQCKEYRECPEANTPVMPRTKEDLFGLVRSRQVSPFDPTNVGGHGSTRYVEWGAQLPGTVQPIPCVKSNRYEPYLIFRYCDALPPYQELFSGYGKNKMTVCP